MISEPYWKWSGPASYDIKGPILEKLQKKQNVHAVVRAPFANTAERVTTVIARDAAWTPSPAEYPQDVDEEEESGLGVYNSVFMSEVERFKPVCPKVISALTQPLNPKTGLKTSLQVIRLVEHVVICAFKS